MRPKHFYNVPRSSYDYRLNGDILLLYDLNGPRSLTNDMERALAEIAQDTGWELNGRTIIYRDSMGRWDGVEYRNGLIDFYHVGGEDEAEALIRVRNLKSFT